MKIEIDFVRNGFLLKVTCPPSAADPLGENRKHGGTWFCRDTIDLMGRISAAVQDALEPIQDQFDRD